VFFKALVVNDVAKGGAGEEVSSAEIEDLRTLMVVFLPKIYPNEHHCYDDQGGEKGQEEAIKQIGEPELAGRSPLVELAENRLDGTEDFGGHVFSVNLPDVVLPGEAGGIDGRLHY